MNSAQTLKPEDILTPAELAKRLKVDVSWVYKNTDSRPRSVGKSLPVLRVGRYLRFAWPDVVEWMRAGGR